MSDIVSVPRAGFYHERSVGDGFGVRVLSRIVGVNGAVQSYIHHIFPSFHSTQSASIPMFLEDGQIKAPEANINSLAALSAYNTASGAPTPRIWISNRQPFTLEEPFERNGRQISTLSPTMRIHNGLLAPPILADAVVVAGFNPSQSRRSSVSGALSSELSGTETVMNTEGTQEAVVIERCPKAAALLGLGQPEVTNPCASVVHG